MAVSLGFILMYCRSASVDINKTSWEKILEVLVTMTCVRIIRLLNLKRYIAEYRFYSLYEFSNLISFLLFNY